jgi:hypothetical protein
MPGGLPSQLVKLTSLHMAYHGQVEAHNVAQDFQHIGSLTALQELHISVPNGQRLSHELTGLQHLSMLTSLDFAAPGIKFDHRRTHAWACVTALQSLTLRKCTLQTDALAAFTQLRALCLEDPRWAYTSSVELPAAIAELQLLTELRVHNCTVTDVYAAAALSCLTASTNLCALEVDLMKAPATCTLFAPGTEYPHLRQIRLLNRGRSPPADSLALSVDKQQLQQLCSCCPALQILVCIMRLDRDPEALQPLLQLTALERSEIQLACPMAPAAAPAAIAAAVGVIAQLTGLRQVWLSGPPALQKSMLMPLTALRALTGLEVVFSEAHPRPCKGYGWKEHLSFEVRPLNACRACFV